MPKDPDFSTMSDREVAMMEWRGHMSRTHEDWLSSPESRELARLSTLADAELTKRGIGERFC